MHFFTSHIFICYFSDGEEVFNWILEAAEEAGDDWDGGRVVWILRYVIQPSADEKDASWLKTDPFSNFSDERHKLTTRLEVQKDDIQAVLPIAKVNYYNMCCNFRKLLTWCFSLFWIFVY